MKMGLDDFLVVHGAAALHILIQKSVQPGSQPESIKLKPLIRKAAELIKEFPTLRPVLVNSLIRRTETCNIIASSKVGKTWLALNLSVSVGTGRTWIDLYETLKGEVLYLDFELHPKTFSRRLNDVCGAMRIRPEDCGVSVDNVRGRGLDLLTLGDYIDGIEKDRYAMLVIDALYRAWPEDLDENSNSDVTKCYNLLDAYAERLGSSIVVIHHASKGDQSGKALTDVGSGAGAISRAADTHIALRPHEEADCFTMEAVSRSFKRTDARVIRWTWPTWENMENLSPAAKEGVRNARQVAKDRQSFENIKAALAEAEGKQLTRRSLRTNAGGIGADRLDRLIHAMRQRDEITLVTEGRQEYVRINNPLCSTNGHTNHSDIFRPVWSGLP